MSDKLKLKIKFFNLNEHNGTNCFFRNCDLKYKKNINYNFNIKSHYFFNQNLVDSCNKNIKYIPWF